MYADSSYRQSYKSIKILALCRGLHLCRRFLWEGSPPIVRARQVPSGSTFLRTSEYLWPTRPDLEGQTLNLMYLPCPLTRLSSFCGLLGPKPRPRALKPEARFGRGGTK